MQKVTIIVQKVIKIVQLHLLLPAFKPVILITAPHVGRGGFERIRAEYIIKRHYVAESARRVSGGGGRRARARNVPQNEVQTNYVPHVPHLRYSWGTQYSRPQDGKYFEKIEKFGRARAAGSGGYYLPRPDPLVYPSIENIWQLKSELLL